MKKLAFAAVTIAALAAAGAAVARGIGGGGQSMAAVTGTFTATAVTNSATRSCTTTAGKTIASTKATYTGTASGAPDLTGPAVIAARSTIDTTDGIGIVTGTLKVAGRTTAQFSAVYDHGTIAGTASGHVGTPHVQLVANVSAAFSTTGGFTNGKIGGTAGGSAIELATRGCNLPKPPSADPNDVTGMITASNAASITVGHLTCAVPGSLAMTVAANYPVGSRAEIKCALVSGVMTLVSATKK
jgi:hypothetical protein